MICNNIFVKLKQQMKLLNCMNGWLKAIVIKYDHKNNLWSNFKFTIQYDKIYIE